MNIKSKALQLLLCTVLISSSRAALADEPPCESYICIEAESGVVISEYNADVRRPPASMIKLMIMLMVDEGIERGDWTWDTKITATEKAQRMGGTQVYLERGEVRTVEELMDATAIASANDAAMALAEGLWGSEEAYLAAMNARAQELGMIDSKFHSVHGLPPDKGEDFDQTTARDMAILGQWFVRHPKLMDLTRKQELVFRPGEAVKYNTNKLLWRMEECDGLKTGYIRAAGFCLTASATRDGIRVISVLMGCANKNRRFDYAKHLLEDGLSDVRHATILAADEPAKIEIPIRNARRETFNPVAAEDLTIILKSGEEEHINLQTEIAQGLSAPITIGTRVGTLRASVNGHPRGEVALVVGRDIGEPSWKWKLIQALPSAGGQ